MIHFCICCKTNKVKSINCFCDNCKEYVEKVKARTLNARTWAVPWERKQHLIESLEYLSEPKTMGEVYADYKEDFSYKTFQRLIRDLSERELIKSRTIVGGKMGTTTLLWR